MLNKQGENIPALMYSFPILNQSVVPCIVLTVASWPAYRFLRRQVRWSGIPISLRILQSVFLSGIKFHKSRDYVYCIWSSLLIESQRPQIKPLVRSEC